MLKALGCPEIIFIVLGMSCVGSSKQTGQSLKKSLQINIERQTMLPDVRVVNGEDSIQLARSLCTISPKSISWRSQRSCLVSDSVVFKDTNETTEKCSLELTGFLRGAPMSVNSLVHVLGVGTARLVSVSSVATLRNQEQPISVSVMIADVSR